MTVDAVLDDVLALTRAAVREGLFADVDSLVAGIEGAGWARDATGGFWLRPGEPAWSLISSGDAPGFSVFFADEEAATVFATGQELARRLNRGDESLHRDGGGPRWPEWSREDPRWADWTGPEADWVRWDGGPVQVSLYVQPAHQSGGVRSAPHLHFNIDRTDTPAEGLSADDGRVRRIARTGSITEH